MISLEIQFKNITELIKHQEVSAIIDQNFFLRQNSVIKSRQNKFRFCEDYRMNGHSICKRSKKQTQDEVNKLDELMKRIEIEK